MSQKNFIYVLIGILLILLIYIIHNLFLSIFLYRLLLVRTSKRKWSRGFKKIKGKEQEMMYYKGIIWAKEFESIKKEVFILNDGLYLYGEYFDFGYKNAVIIIPGYSEGCKYSYYYAIPYKKLGLNVLVIDNRCTGLSDGKYLTFGIKEYTDILLWGKLLRESYDIAWILLHGICIGSATALFTLTSKNVPSYFYGMIADGMYSTFYEIFLNHVKAFKQPRFPVPQIVFSFVKRFSKVDARNNGPIFSIEKLDKPILFLHSEQDKFSLPEKAEEMYRKCKSEKTIVWFEKGGHSRIRINNEQKYDDAIKDFVEKLKLHQKKN